MTEDKLQENISKYMSTWFNVTREVKSNDGKCRIDIIMIHKSDIYKKYPIGIEVKLVEKKQGKDLAKWLKQAYKYTQTNKASLIWDGVNDDLRTHNIERLWLAE